MEVARSSYVRGGFSPAFIRKPIATNIEYDFKNGNLTLDLKTMLRQLYHTKQVIAENLNVELNLSTDIDMISSIYRWG